MKCVYIGRRKLYVLRFRGSKLYGENVCVDGGVSEKERRCMFVCGMVDLRKSWSLYILIRGSYEIFK